MNKVGYILSLVGGVLAIVFSMLLFITGLAFTVGDDVISFANKNSSEEISGMVADIGDYYRLDMFTETDLDTYIEDYVDVFKDLEPDDLEDIGEEYNISAFDDAAMIYRDVEDYLPNLYIGLIACLASSVIALVGAVVAVSHRMAGGVMVLAGAALALVFSLVANSILPMAFASLLLMLGGIFQMAKPKAVPDIRTPQSVDGGAL